MTYRVIGDWGTTRLRLFRIEDDAVVDRVEAAGIGAIATGDLSAETVLRDALERWRAAGDPVSVMLCGMIGSRNGWVEVPYANCPADEAAWSAGATRLLLDAIPVTIMPGLACLTPSGAPDVMRGEETQIFGAIARNPALATGRHRLALPGTHSKWATIDDGRILSFETYFTGEMFGLLRDRSTLLRAAAPAQAGDDPDADDAAGFADGIARAASATRLLGAVFEARSAQLQLGRSAPWATGFLSGLLIGREILEATEATGVHDRVTLIGDPSLTARYARALALVRARVGAAGETSVDDGDLCALAGLIYLASDAQP